MNLFDVYPLNDIEITKAAGSNVWDANNQKYLDLYGGHDCLLYTSRCV